METATIPTAAPASSHIMAKPSGSVCNIDCKYCFYLEKEKLYPDARKNWRMSDETLELYVKQYIEAQDVPQVDFAWQGGEPTLMGVDFFRRAVELQQQYADGKLVTNAFQTNGILLDDEWGEFLAENKFLIGLSIDGPRTYHDHYRVDKGQKPTYDRVYAGLQMLKKHGVEFNTLTVLQNHNADNPLEIYRFLREEGSGFMQFIPIVERIAYEPDEDGLELVDPEYEGRAPVSKWSVSPGQYGKFLCAIFDEWVRNDVGQVFVQLFDVTLGSWLGQDASLCIFAETCGKALIIEHNGDLYSCDHFVYSDYRWATSTKRASATWSPARSKPSSDRTKRTPCPSTASNATTASPATAAAPSTALPKPRAARTASTICARGTKCTSGTSIPTCALWPTSCGTADRLSA